MGLRGRFGVDCLIYICSVIPHNGRRSSLAARNVVVGECVCQWCGSGNIAYNPLLSLRESGQRDIYHWQNRPVTLAVDQIDE